MRLYHLQVEYFKLRLYLVTSIGMPALCSTFKPQSLRTSFGTLHIQFGYYFLQGLTFSPNSNCLQTYTLSLRGHVKDI